MRELISTTNKQTNKRKNAQAGSELSNILQKSSHARKKANNKISTLNVVEETVLEQILYCDQYAQGDQEELEIHLQQKINYTSYIFCPPLERYLLPACLYRKSVITTETFCKGKNRDIRQK